MSELEKFLKKYLILTILVIYVILPLAMSWFVYSGGFETQETIISWEIGNFFDANFKKTQLDKSDYELTIKYSTKAAFVVGRKINVEIELKALKNIKKFNESSLMVIFAGASPFGAIDKMKDKRDANCFLEKIDSAAFNGKTDIFYSSTKFLSKSSAIPYNHENEFTYNLMVNNRAQVISKFMRRNWFIEIAPLSTKDQLRHNKINLLITMVVIYYGLIEFIRRRYISDKLDLSGAQDS